MKTAYAQKGSSYLEISINRIIVTFVSIIVLDSFAERLCSVHHLFLINIFWIFFPNVHSHQWRYIEPCYNFVSNQKIERPFQFQLLASGEKPKINRIPTKKRENDSMLSVQFSFLIHFMESVPLFVLLLVIFNKFDRMYYIYTFYLQSEAPNQGNSSISSFHAAIILVFMFDGDMTTIKVGIRYRPIGIVIVNKRTPTIFIELCVKWNMLLTEALNSFCETWVILHKQHEHISNT